MHTAHEAKSKSLASAQVPTKSIYLIKQQVVISNKINATYNYKYLTSWLSLFVIKWLDTPIWQMKLFFGVPTS